MVNNGWICLHRDIQKHWLFNFDEPDKFMAWCDLLMSANHEDRKFMIKGRVVECKRGQVAMSQITLQKRWNMSQNKLKRFLVLLKNDVMIDFETNDLTTIITICNYSKFQNNERADGRPLERADGRGADDHSNDKQQLNNLTIKQNNLNTNTVNSMSLAASVCVEYRNLGMMQANPLHPDLLELIAGGSELQEFVSAGSLAMDAGKGFAYALGIVKNRKQEKLIENSRCQNEISGTVSQTSTKKLSLAEQAERDIELLEQREQSEQGRRERVIN